MMKKCNKFLSLPCIILTAFLCFATMASAYAQNITVKGSVIDGDGLPVVGATVMVDGTTNGAMTDSDGNYTLNNVPSQGSIRFSCIGYAEQVKPVKGAKVINAILIESSESLEEAVAVAFGTQKKESVIGAITTISPQKLKVPSSDLTSALAGNIAGMISFSRSGEPGKENTDFFIRGVATFEGNTNPLILIDNIELTATDLARLQPDDIESFSVMKDATATALYGSRAANGVILVTTKHGQEGSAKVFARFETSVSQPTQMVELADNITYMNLYNEALLTRDPMADLMYNKDKIENTGKPGVNPYIYPNNDWYGMLFKDYSNSYRGTINISGGTKVANYFVSLGLTQDYGVLNTAQKNSFSSNIDSKNYTVRANVGINVTKTTKLGVRLTGNFDDYTGPLNGGDAVWSQVVHADPVLFPPYYAADPEHAYIEHILFGNYGNCNYVNPYAEMVKGYKDRDRSQMLAALDLKQDLSFITEGLSVSGMLNISRLSAYSVQRYYNPFYYTLANYDGFTGNYRLTPLNEDKGTEYLLYSESGKDVTNTVYTEARLNYDRTFGKHGVSGLLVFTTHETLSANAGSLQLSLPSRNVGLAGRFTYNWNSRYFAELNFGYNGSERFAEKHRWGFFPSLGGAWVISNENFWKPLKKAISNFKIRYSYGLVGNDNIGSSADRFYYLSNVSFNGSGQVFGQNADVSYPGVSISRYANDNISWETAYKSNYAVELGFFDKLNITAEYYQERRTNILMNRADVPYTMGLTSAVKANIGEAFVNGIDIQSEYKQSWSKDFWTSGRFNFTYARSNYLVYEEPNYSEDYRFHVGYPIKQTWGFVAKNLFLDDAEVRSYPAQTFGEYAAGDIKYLDLNKDGQITNADMAPIGYPTTPEIIYGFGISTGYKGFDLSVFFQGLANESFFISQSATAPFQNYTQLLKVYADSHWSEDNPDPYAVYPRLSTVLNSNNNQTSTWWMRDGSFLRLKQAEFGYTLPYKWTSKLHIENLRLYLSGTNLLTFSKFKYWDPELAGSGLNYPIMRTINFGLNVTFK